MMREFDPKAPQPVIIFCIIADQLHFCEHVARPLSCRANLLSFCLCADCVKMFTHTVYRHDFEIAFALVAEVLRRAGKVVDLFPHSFRTPNCARVASCERNRSHLTTRFVKSL